MSGAGDLSGVADLQAIRQRIAQHSRGVDRADEALLADCYHEDATVDYRFFAGPAKELAAMLTAANKGQPVMLHRTSQMWVLLDGERAKSESYIIAYAQSPDPDGAMMQRLVCGRYLDRHEKRAGVWRLSHRQYVMDVNANWPGAYAPPALGSLANHVPAGAQGAADPGIALLASAAAKNRLIQEGDQGMSNPPPDEAAIDAVISRQKIADLTMAYCRGVDRADEDLLKTIFHDDSIVISGAFNGGGQQFATEICRIVKAVFNQTFHSIANQWIEVTGNAAVGETYVIAVSTMTNEDGSQSEMLTGGRYLDRFERRAGIWKISERSFVCDWNRVDATTHSNDGMYAPLDLLGRRGPEDPVYALWN
ncbi:nuclear transport factor 2 family protein [Sphingobium phenoxybenzoativorans]|uniref:nuclear transport factor 2 family protein n=1 Tax=Sphingobium phenoxybenzoativorans TaxID=1592790 RepID=UPI00087276A6|nr:nuclear transport factor 2 family protein [Sphingobium phenoxybenzoativorans]